MQYYCSECRQPCTAELHEVGPVASCHAREEARLMVKRGTDELMALALRLALDLIVSAHPSPIAVEMLWYQRSSEFCALIKDLEIAPAIEQHLTLKDLSLRHLTPDEERDLAEQLAEENDAEMTPAMRARERVMRGS